MSKEIGTKSRYRFYICYRRITKWKKELSKSRAKVEQKFNRNSTEKYIKRIYLVYKKSTLQYKNYGNILKYA